MKCKRRCVLAAMALFVCADAYAAESDKIQGAYPAREVESGFSGNTSLGAMYSIVRNNMVSSAGFGLVPVGEASLNTLNAEPTKNFGILPMVTLNLRYNFATTDAGVFLSTSSTTALFPISTSTPEAFLV